MPTITADGRRIEVDAGTRLVLAIEALGIDIGHRCGGKARCTTCRVTVEEGAPATYTRAEFLKLQGADLLAPEGAAEPIRLSCQILVERDMTVRVIKTKQTEGWPDTGPQVGVELVPEPERFDRATLEADVAAG